MVRRDDRTIITPSFTQGWARREGERNRERYRERERERERERGGGERY